MLFSSNAVNVATNLEDGVRPGYVLQWLQAGQGISWVKGPSPPVGLLSPARGGRGGGGGAGLEGSHHMPIRGSY